MSELIPEGFYRAVAVQVDTEEYGPQWAQFGTTKNGNDQVVVVFEIIDGPCMGRRLTWFGYFTKDTTKRTLESLRYCGWKGDDLMALPNQEIDQEVQLVVKHETYEGKTHARIAWVNNPGGGGVKLANPMGESARRTFAARMREYAKQVPEVSGKKAERGAGGNGEAGSSATGGADGTSAHDRLPF